MPKTSAGLLMYRKKNGQIEVLIAHPGGPFFAKKDAGVWSIPKGEVEEGEDLLNGAMREFKEETSIDLTNAKPKPAYMPLGTVKTKSGKIIHAWAFEMDYTGEIKCNTFEMEWPPHSGKTQSFPENDRTEFLPIEVAREKMTAEQAVFLDRLLSELLALLRTTEQ